MLPIAFMRLRSASAVPAMAIPWIPLLLRRAGVRRILKLAQGVAERLDFLLIRLLLDFDSIQQFRDLLHVRQNVVQLLNYDQHLLCCLLQRARFLSRSRQRGFGKVLPSFIPLPTRLIRTLVGSRWWRLAGRYPF